VAAAPAGVADALIAVDVAPGMDRAAGLEAVRRRFGGDFRLGSFLRLRFLAGP
jgi:hypothetical protein